MGNTDNNSKHLIPGQDTYPDFDKIFQMQKTLQEKAYGTKFEGMDLEMVASFWFINKHALEDELSEMFDALGGINDGIGNAVWKPWKKDNAKSRNMTIDSLSEDDKKELLMEIVDGFHFFMNFAVSVGFTGSDIANAYVTKNKENYKRQEEGY